MDQPADQDRIVATAYAVHAGSIRRYLGSVTRDHDVAEDLTQDAFLRLTVEVGAGRVPDDIGAWLRRVAFNLAMSRGRRQSVADRHLAGLVQTTVASSPEAAAIHDEDAVAAVRALGMLPAIHRQAIVLASFGVDGPEIARTIGRTQGATRTLLCRARARVRTAMLAEETALQR
jgi:RNA polymerase sigma-70 factor (ECF subfamily)